MYWYQSHGGTWYAPETFSARPRPPGYGALLKPLNLINQLEYLGSSSFSRTLVYLSVELLECRSMSHARRLRAINMRNVYANASASMPYELLPVECLDRIACAWRPAAVKTRSRLGLRAGRASCPRQEAPGKNASGREKLRTIHPDPRRVSRHARVGSQQHLGLLEQKVVRVHRVVVRPDLQACMWACARDS